MAQLRQDYHKFIDREAEIVVIGPDQPQAFKSYWEKNNLPFSGLPDPKGTVLKKFGQEVNIFKMGRMPAQAVIDKHGIVRFVHYGHSMADIPRNEEILAILDKINKHDQLSMEQAGHAPG